MRYRIIPSRPFNAFMNMALDEAIVEGVAEKTSPPTIRFYTWSPAAVSIGYFQGIRNEVNLEECEKQGVDVVRRRTGGGAVYHDPDGEITYSIIAPESCFAKGILDSYREICGCIVDALKALGISAEFSPINDVLVGGKKISGSAQTRKEGVLLQHGTLLLNVEPEKMFSLLRVSKEKISDKLIRSVMKRVTSIRDVADVPVKRVEEELINAFSKGRDVFFSNYSEGELARAKQLAEQRYSSFEWNHMR